MRLSAAACDAFLADSRPVEAAWAALVLGTFHVSRGDEPQGMGWIGRAGRLLRGVPKCPVHGYLLHLTEVEASLQAGQPAAAVDERLGARRPARGSPDGLTRRECEVLALVADGRSNRAIGEALHMSDRTVARHLTNIFHKIDGTSRTQAARRSAAASWSIAPMLENRRAA